MHRAGRIILSCNAGGSGRHPSEWEDYIALCYILSTGLPLCTKFTVFSRRPGEGAMPCKDTSSRITVVLDGRERFRSVAFEKITCGKTIGEGSALSRYCVGRALPEIAGGDGEEIRRRLGIEADDDRFLFQLEWNALQAALARYTGDDEEIGADRYKVASVVHDADRVEIALVIFPPADLPPVLPCSKSAPPPETV